MADSFEDHLAALEKIVEELESGDLSLDDSLKGYQDGVGRLKACYALLREAEGKVTILLRDADGELAEEPFGDEAGDGA